MLCQNRANQLRALFDTQLSAVQRHIVRLNLPPFLAGVEAIIGASTLILTLQPLLRSLGPLAVLFHNALCPEGHAQLDLRIPATRCTAFIAELYLFFKCFSEKQEKGTCCSSLNKFWKYTAALPAAPCAYEISTYALVIGDASVIQGLPLIQLAQPVPFFQQIVRFLHQLQSGSIVPVHDCCL